MNIKEAIYDKEISPFMTQIIKICKENQISMVASFELDLEEDHEPDDPLMCTTSIILPGAFSSALKKASEVLTSRVPTMCLAETIQTMPDGTKKITISRV